MNKDLKKKVIDWIENDVCKVDKTELKKLLYENNENELNNRFSAELEFGTSGLRGEIGAGPNRMNQKVIRKTAYGIGKYALSKIPDPKIIIGYDARHRSKKFAFDSALVFLNLGISTYIMSKCIPTPVLTFALKHYNYDVGIMVTASHNPAKDNGYKVYLGGKIITDNGQGSLIISPEDKSIMNNMNNAPKNIPCQLNKKKYKILGENITDDYTNNIVSGIGKLNPLIGEDINITFTSMHGVGNDIMLKAFDKYGIDNIHIVNEQSKPDPNFPTITFPNPEEKGAMDLALKYGKKNKSDLIFALDPDADRFACIIYDSNKNEYKQLNGDEVGILLTSYFVEKIKKGILSPKSTISNSIASSRMPEIICKNNNIKHKTTLTGFKWISRVDNLVFGYEESIGYCVLPEIVHDKDGISTALLISSIICELKMKNKNIMDLLNTIYINNGLFLQKYFSIRLHSNSEIEKVVRTLLENPPKYLSDEKVVKIINLNNKNPIYPSLPPTNGILILTDKNTRILSRPSGTEPKVKFYLESYSKINPKISANDIEIQKNNDYKRLDNISKYFINL